MRSTSSLILTSDHIVILRAILDKDGAIVRDIYMVISPTMTRDQIRQRLRGMEGKRLVERGENTAEWQITDAGRAVLAECDAAERDAP